MARSLALEKLPCACGALLLRPNATGIEVHCHRCKRRVLIPFNELKGKEHLVRFMDTWRARERRP